ncbi:MAG: hypothetical protein M1319_03685 [Chloroflexi bacterium]|nr:hypothetical protein [Chloroflexota bacterium]
MEKLVMLWNVVPENQERFDEVVEDVFRNIAEVHGIAKVRLYRALSSYRTYPPHRGTEFAYCAEMELHGADTTEQSLWRDPEYKVQIERLSTVVSDLAPLGLDELMAFQK